MTPDELRNKLTEQFPVNATCWSQATEEVRDMCRWARGILGLDEDQAVDFREIKTPSEWNTKGIDGIVSFYEKMNDFDRGRWIERVRSAWENEDGLPAFFGNVT